MDPTPGSDWTGERLVAGAGGDAVVEHLHRYALACECAAGRDVLDIACGEGYGSALLAQVAHSVTGVDLDDATVAQAAAKYPRPNLRFVAGSATAIPLGDAVCDLVVSFETIEHLAEHDQMLAELRRVLRPGGLLLISSPDRREYTDAAHYRNPFHVKELDAGEFTALLQRHFSHVRVLGQRILYGSAIAGDGVFQTYAGDVARISAAPGVPQARYLVALCSDAALPLLPPSLFEDVVERLALGSSETAYRIEAAGSGWLRRLFAREAPVRLGAELACKIRSFTVTLRGSIPPGTTAVRVRLRDKLFEGRIEEEEFVAEVNVGSGRHPCLIEICEAGGAWREALRVRVEAPEVAFKARERSV